MRSIERTPLHQRFLMVGWRLSTSAWRREVDGVLAWTSSSDSGIPQNQRDKMTALVSTPLTETSIPLVVLHAYADVDTGMRWDRVFDPRDPTSNTDTTAMFRFSVLWRRAAVDSLSHGHHQTAVVDFPDGCPDLISTLSEDAPRPDFGYVGLCDQSSMSAIINALQNG